MATKGKMREANYSKNMANCSKRNELKANYSKNMTNCSKRNEDKAKYSKNMAARARWLRPTTARGR